MNSYGYRPPARTDGLRAEVKIKFKNGVYSYEIVVVGHGTGAYVGSTRSGYLTLGEAKSSARLAGEVLIEMAAKVAAQRGGDGETLESFTVTL